MATRGTLYRCHLCSFLFGDMGPQTPDVESSWWDLQGPVADRELPIGNVATLLTATGAADWQPDEDVSIRFDILREGIATDDQIGSILNELAVEEDGFPVLDRRMTRRIDLSSFDSPEEAVNLFVLQHPLDFDNFILVMSDPVESGASYVATWWRVAEEDADVHEGDFYFIVNIGGAFEDKSEPALKARGRTTTVDLIDLRREPVDESESTEDAADLDLDYYSDLPGGTGVAIDEPSFRQSALMLVRGSGVLDDLEETDEEPEPPASDLPPGSPPVVEFNFPALNVLTGEFEEEENTEFTRPPDLGPYGTGWMFLHPEEASPGLPDREEHAPTKLDDVALAILRDSDWTTLQLDTKHGYRLSYTLQGAAQWGRALYGVRTFAILELPLVPYKSIDKLRAGDPKRELSPVYLVAPLQKPFSTAGVEKAAPIFQGMLETIVNRYLNRFPLVDIPWKKEESGYAAVRLFSTVDRRLLHPLSPEFVLLESKRQMELIDEGPPKDAATRAALRDAAFSSIDAALAAHDDDAAEAGLVKLDAYAYRLLAPGRRGDHLKFLASRFGFLSKKELDNAVFEIIKAVESKAEIDDLIKDLGQATFNKLVEGMESNLWSLLTHIGEKLAESKGVPVPKFDLEFVGELLTTLAFGKSSPSGVEVATKAASLLALGTSGLLVNTDMSRDLYMGSVRLVRFVEGTIDGIVQMVSNPKQLIDAAGQLLKLYMTLEMARLLLPEALPNEPKWLTELRKQRDAARESIATTLSRVGKALMHGYMAAKYLKLESKVMARVQWTLLWEILSLFIGVGELKAAFNIVRAGVEAGSIALIVERIGVGISTRATGLFKSFSRILGRESRLIATEEEAVRALSHLPTEELQEIERTLLAANADEGVLTFKQLLDKNPAEAASLLAKRQQVEAVAQIVSKTRGPLPHGVDEVLKKLTAVPGMTEKELLRIAERLPDGQGAHFIEAVRVLPQEAMSGATAYVSPEFLEQLAGRPDWMQVIRRGDARQFGAIYRHAAGDAAKVDDMVLNLENVARDLGVDKDKLRSLVSKVEAGDDAALKQLAKPRDVPTHAPGGDVRPSTGTTGGTGTPDGTPPGGGVRLPGEGLPPDPPPHIHEEVYDLFNREVGFYGPENGFDDSMRQTINRLADNERGMFRSVVADLRADRSGRKARFLEHLAESGYTPDEVQKADKALEALNTQFRTQTAAKVDATFGIGLADTAEDIAKKRAKFVDDRISGVKKYQDAGRAKVRELDARIKEYNAKKRSRFSSPEEKVRARDRVAALKREKAQLKEWIKDTDARRAEFAELAKEIKNSPLLRDRLAHGGEKTLARLWADMKFRPRNKPPVKSTFEKYVTRRMGEFRGYSGEMDLGFLMAEDFNLLKAPDAFVTRRGLDLVAMRRGDRVLAILDNKSFTSKLLEDVSALTRNLVNNLRTDAAEFRKLSRALVKPQREYEEMASRMAKAADEIEPLMKGASGGPLSAADEARALKILKDNKIPTRDMSVVTGNLVTDLRSEAAGFRRMSKEFADASPDFLDAADRMTDVANRLEPILARRRPGLPFSPTDESEIARILQDNNMQLLVSNVGGHTADVSPILGKHIQLWDVRKAGRHESLPVPPAP